MEMIIFFIVLGITLVLFFMDKWRYDVVALFSLLLLTVIGIIPSEETFSGFYHPAVITVAAILIISKSIMKTGVIGKIASQIWKISSNSIVHILLICITVAVLSAFMNNVGALALCLPIALELAKKGKYSPSLILMPLAFSSLLGGLSTMIGTPPNIIIATFREEYSGESFALFDFFPTGSILFLVGIAFISLIGWRLLPMRAKNLDEEILSLNEYVTEVRIPKENNFIGKSLYDVKKKIEIDEWNVLCVVRQSMRIQSPDKRYHIREGDILVVEANPETIKELISSTSWVFEAQTSRHSSDVLVSEDSVIQEAVVMSDSKMVGKTILQMKLRTHYSINVLGLSRQGKMFSTRIVKMKIKAGDVLMLQGSKDSFHEFFEDMSCLPLESKGWEFPVGKPNIMPIFWFALIILIVLTGILSFHIAFMVLVFLLMVFNHLSLQEVYESIEGPVLVLLAAMIPVGLAMQSTGGATWVANGLLQITELFPVSILLGILMLITMLLSNIINNAATAILMAPIGLELSRFYGYSADPFLMGIAIAASCAFLTPIGHQSNTLVMGPGGYRFSDYWRMGLPVSIIMLIVAIPLVLWIWPF